MATKFWREPPMQSVNRMTETWLKSIAEMLLIVVIKSAAWGVLATMDGF